MALLDIWDYVRASGDRRLRKQGYASSGMGILERYRRAGPFWAPHLEANRRNLAGIAERLLALSSTVRDARPTTVRERETTSRGGTLLVLGAGRLLDVPWETLFPCFERVVLYDADFCIVPYVERLLAASTRKGIPTPLFEIGDLTASVVDTAAWAEHTLGCHASAAAAAAALAQGFALAETPQAAWTRAYADVRLALSTNLLSQLGYFPRLHVQTEFKKRFKKRFSEFPEAAENLECYFDRVRARHVLDLCALRHSWTYLSTDVDAVTYRLRDKPVRLPLEFPPLYKGDAGGVELDARGELQFAWPVEILEHSDPLHGQRVKDLWPAGAAGSTGLRAGLEGPRRWVWHIVPQGSEKAYQDRGRVHVVESWTRC